MTAVELECGCTRQYIRGAPQAGRLIWCPRHETNTTPATGAPGVWTVQCTGCVYARYYGMMPQSELPARTYGAKHMTSTRHVLYSFQIGAFNETLHRHAPAKNAPVGANDPPPF